MNEFNAKVPLAVARTSFPHLQKADFVDFFKLTSRQVADYLQIPQDALVGDSKAIWFRRIRNFLMTLYWCRHYPSFSHLAVLFGLERSHARKIVKRQVQLLAAKIGDYVDTRMIESLDGFFLRDCVGVVDSTEVPINTWVGDSYSGKKKAFTLKYQVVISLHTKMPVQISGPYFGKVADSKVWEKSGMGQFLQEEGLWVLGDKGYQGCARVKHCLKKRKGEARLPHDKKEYNRLISKQRVFVENHFAELKVMKALSHKFRGMKLSFHGEVFNCCEVILFLSKL
jgi:IS5 family transposase